MRQLQLLLGLAYPLLVHLALVAGAVQLGLWLLAGLSLLHLFTHLHDHALQRPTALLLPLLLFGLAGYGLAYDDLFALYLPPILVSASGLLLFGRTLQAGREPLISRFVRLVYEENDPAVLAYTRRITWLWTLFFAFMVLETSALALWAPLELWSLIANLLNYLAIAAVMLAELVWRRWRFQRRSGVLELLQRLRRAPLARLWEA